jgi:hypothetical protein
VSFLTFILNSRIIVTLFVNIHMDLKLIVWGVNWIDLAQDIDNWQAPVETAMKFR